MLVSGSRVVKSAPVKRPDKKRARDRDLEEDRGTSAIILAGVLVVVAALALLYGLQTIIYMEARIWGHSNPELYETPKQLAALPGQVPAGTDFSFYGFEFDVPWKSDYKTDYSPATYKCVTFNSGQAVVFFDPSSFVNSAAALQKAAPAKYLEVANIFGAQPFASSAALFDAVYGASPAQVSPWMDRRAAMRLDTLLLWKMSFEAPGRGGIFSFDSGSLHGLQFGDPDQSPVVTMRLFDGSDRQFRFLFTTTAGSAAKLTQDEISGIAQSLRPVSISKH